MAPAGLMESVEIEGFLSIRSARLQLRRLNVLIGANGAGKSNLVRLFEFLGRLVEQDLGFFVGQNGGASALLHDGGDNRMRVRIDMSRVAYEAAFVLGSDDELIFRSERLLRDDRQLAVSRRSSRGSRESRLTDMPPSRSRQEMVDLLAGCRVFHFHDTGREAAVKQRHPTADSLGLRAQAENLAPVLLEMKGSDDSREIVAYRRIVGAVRLVAPFFRDFVLVPSNRDRVRLRWRQHGSDTIFSANQMSDGTLRFICLATLLLQPDLPRVVVLDEPELGLHPFAMVQLAELIRQAARRSQVLFATQSVTLLSQFELDDVIVADRVDGASVFSRPDPDSLTQWLDDYSVGDLWEKGLLNGGPRRENRGTDA